MPSLAKAGNSSCSTEHSGLPPFDGACVFILDKNIKRDFLANGGECVWWFEQGLCYFSKLDDFKVQKQKFNIDHDLYKLFRLYSEKKGDSRLVLVQGGGDHASQHRSACSISLWTTYGFSWHIPKSPSDLVVFQSCCHCILPACLYCWGWIVFLTCSSHTKNIPIFFFMIKVWRNNFWMLHHGSKSPKRTTVWSIRKILVAALAITLEPQYTEVSLIYIYICTFCFGMLFS